jgi:hypothetical protein
VCGGRRGLRSPARVADGTARFADFVALSRSFSRLLCGNRKCGLRPQATPSAYSCDCLLGECNSRFRLIADIEISRYRSFKLLDLQF